MPRISKVYDPRLKLRYGFMFDIQDYKDLQGWWDTVRASISQKDFAQAMRWKDGKDHANILAQLAEMRGVSLVEQLAKINEDLGRGMDRVLQEQKRFFINELGGYFGFHPSLIISETRDVDVWALPEEKVRIIQWPDGTHFYAKVGNEDVEVDGVQKWDTRQAAEAAGEFYLTGKRR